MNLRVLTETAKTVTVGWDSVPGAVGYDFYVDGKRVSFTHDGTRTSVKFGKPDAGQHDYSVRTFIYGERGLVTVPVPPPPPPPPPPPDGAFMSYPAMQPRDYSGDTDIELHHQSLRGFHQNHVLHFENCHNIWVHHIDMDDCGGTSEACIYFLNCTGTIRVEDIRFRQPGYHSIQLNDCQVTGHITRVKVKGALRSEDMISLYQSGGTSSADPFVIEDNQFEGGDWVSGSGSGIMLGDGGGGHIIARRNRMLNPGQVGIGVAGGSDIGVEDNTVYGQQMPKSNVGIYAWHQSGPPSADVWVTGNKVNWRRADGVPNPWWNGGNNIANLQQSGNDWNAPIDPASLVVTL